MKTIGLISLGCPKNLVDSEVMLGLLEGAGYKVVQDPAEAEVLIVNTCGFIEDAKKEAVETILEMAGYKGRGSGKCKRLVVAGCLPQRYKGELTKLLPEVDLFVGTGEYHKIVELLDGTSAKQQDSKTAKQHIGIPRYIHNSDVPRKIATPRHAVYLKIAEGCFHACSFCIIPKLRGGFRSRPVEDIVGEAKKLLAAGAKELNIIAQDTTAYGRDLGSSLARLLERLGGLPGKKWLRFLYAYPNSFTDGLIDVMKDFPDVCKYVDIPIQHISDRTLKAMHRPETGAEIRRLICKLRDRIPNITLRTSLIVGFPGETMADFRELLDFVEEGHFDHLGVFTYSCEEGTAAAKMKGQIPKKTKETRKGRVMEAQVGISKARNNSKLGKIVKVLVDGRSEEGFYGRTEGQAPEIDGMVYLTGPGFKAGEFSRTKITAATEYDLMGEAL